MAAIGGDWPHWALLTGASGSGRFAADGRDRIAGVGGGAGGCVGTGGADGGAGVARGWTCCTWWV